MRACAFLLIGIGFLSPLAYGQDQVAVLIIDNEHTPAWKKAHLELFKRTHTLQRLKQQGNLSYWETDDRAKYWDADAFRGRVYLVSPDGRFQKAYFSSMRDEVAFQQNLEDLMQRRMDKMPEDLKPEIIISGDIRTIKTPAYTYRDDPNRRSLGGELHQRYVDGISAMGREDAGLKLLRRLPLKSIARLSRRAKGKMWYQLYRPQVVPAEYRDAALALVSKAASTGLQQRDQESDSDYRDRRLVSDAQLSLLKSLVFDIDEITAFTQLSADGNEPFRASVKLVALDHTPLSQLIRQLRTRRSVTVERGNLGYLQVSAAIPAELRPVAAAVARNLLGSTRIDGMEAAIKDGELVFGARVDKEDDGLRLVAEAPIKLTASDLSLLAARQAASSESPASGGTRQRFRTRRSAQFTTG